MGKETRILEHEPDAAPIGGKKDALRGIDQHAVVEDEEPRSGRASPRDQADGHGFPGARAAEQGGDAGIAREGDVEIEGAELQRDVDADHAALSVPRHIYTHLHLPSPSFGNAEIDRDPLNC